HTPTRRTYLVARRRQSRCSARSPRRTAEPMARCVFAHKSPGIAGCSLRLGISVNTVMAYLHKARPQLSGKLRKWLGEVHRVRGEGFRKYMRAAADSLWPGPSGLDRFSPRDWKNRHQVTFHP